MNRLSALLAARSGTRQLDALAQADAAADRAERSVRRGWDRVIAFLLSRPAPWAVQRGLTPILRELFASTGQGIHGDLAHLGRWGYQSAAGVLRETLSADYVRAAAVRRAMNPSADAGEVREAAEPGLVHLGLSPAGLTTSSPVSDAAHEDLLDLLFPPLSLERLTGILTRPVFGLTWQQDWSQATKLADPNVLMGMVAGAFAAGQTPQQVARTIQPLVQNVSVSARRIARTYGMQVAHHAQMQAHDQLGDLVIGYQVHALLDAHTRPAHAHRSGTIYYRDPKPGQLSLDEMPNPPLEADGSMAWNCRCHLTPVLKPLEATRNDSVFTEPPVQPAHEVYSDWFDQADERRRRLAVGARRYALVQDLVGAGAVTGTLPAGQAVEFIPHPHQRHDEVLVLVDPQRLSAGWTRNRGNYLPPAGQGQGETEVPGRREGFQRFLAKGAAVQAPKVSLTSRGVDFDDGRHRFATLRDAGISQVAIAVPRKQVRDFQRRFAAVPLPATGGRPGWEHFVGDDGGLLGTHELKAEDAAARAQRTARVRVSLAKNRAALRQVARLGFE